MLLVPRGPLPPLNVHTALLNEIDGVEVLRGIIVVEATNYPELIDPALMRPGRLDTILYVASPDLEGRPEILKIKTRKMAIASGVDLDELAEVSHPHDYTFAHTDADPRPTLRGLRPLRRG